MFTNISSKFHAVLNKFTKKDEIHRLLALEQQVNTIENDKAEKYARKMLESNVRWRVKRDTVDSGELYKIENLGPQLQRFFIEFSRIDDLHSNFRIARDMIDISCLSSGLVVIGTDLDLEYLIVPKGLDTVYISSFKDRIENDTTPYTTIYHLILFIAVLCDDISLASILHSQKILQ